MSAKPISPLRQRMIDDMTARRFGEKVQKAYVRLSLKKQARRKVRSVSTGRWC